VVHVRIDGMVIEDEFDATPALPAKMRAVIAACR